LGELAHELARLIGSVDLHNRRIAEIEFLARDTGDQRSSHSDSRRFRCCVRLFADLEIPHWATDIGHAGDSTADVSRERVIEMRLNPCNLVLVPPNTVEIGAVGPREQVIGLKEVNERSEITKPNELAK